MKERKKVDPQIANDILNQNWVRYEIVNHSLFPGLDSIPSGVVAHVYFSGSFSANAPYSSSAVSSATLIGGAEIFRNSPDDPVKYNKDTYAIVMIPGSGYIYVDGPFKDHEHWIDEIPNRFAGTQIYTASRAR